MLQKGSRSLCLPSPQGRNREAEQGDHTGRRRKAGTRAQVSLPLTGLTLPPPPGVQVPGLEAAESRSRSGDLPRWPRCFWGPPGPSIQCREEGHPCGLRGKVSEVCWGSGRVLTVLEGLRQGNGRLGSTATPPLPNLAPGRNPPTPEHSRTGNTGQPSAPGGRLTGEDGVGHRELYSGHRPA